MDEAMTTAYESVKEGNYNAEDFKPYVVKDRNNPNFLKVFIQYPTGTGFTTALGQRTMTGQDREYGAVKAMRIGQAVAAKLESKYNIEDIEVSDNDAGKVIVFAVSDDFIKMNTPSIDEAKDPDHLEKVRNVAKALPYRYNIKPNMGMVKVTSRSKDELVDLKTELAKANLYSEMRPTLAGMFELTVLNSPVNESVSQEVINKVSRFITSLANYYDYSEQDAVYAIMQALRTTNFQGINESKKEDAVDTITMDIPLFLRMLEYSREDASQDMDLHDVTEKANKLGKERGILSMDDYEEIVGAAEDAPKEDMSEGMGGELDEPYFIRVSVRDARKAIDMFDDMYRNSNIKTYGSDVYAANDVSDIYDFFYDLNSQGIEILDANVDGEEEDYDSEYEKTLAEKIANKLKEERPGLWANIHAQRERGEKPARKGSKDYKAAVAAGKRINKEK
jgi:hypothetical protein